MKNRKFLVDLIDAATKLESELHMVHEDEQSEELTTQVGKVFSPLLRLMDCAKKDLGKIERAYLLELNSRSAKCPQT